MLADTRHSGALSDIRSGDAMEMRNPLLPRERKEYRLAEKLRRLRSLRGLTQREVAQAAGIDESTVRSYELRKDGPHNYFSKRDYPAIYPDYDPVKPDSGQRQTSDRFSDDQRTRGPNPEQQWCRWKPICPRLLHHRHPSAPSRGVSPSCPEPSSS